MKPLRALIATYRAAFVIGPITGTAIYQNLGPKVLWLSIGAVGIVLAIAFAALSRPLRGQRRWAVRKG